MKITNEDCIEGMKKMEAGTVDHVFTDPPFGIDFSHEIGPYASLRRDKEKGIERVVPGYHEIPPEEYLDFSRRWIREAYRILKPEGTAIIISGWTRLADVLNAAEEAGFFLINHCIWRYPFGVFCSRKFVTSHYHVLFYGKNQKKWYFNPFDHYVEDVFEFSKALDKSEKTTPNKLPESLVKYLLEFTTREGDLVLEPFSGSGTVPTCCKMLGRDCIAFEIVPAYADIGNQRLQETSREAREPKLNW
jgi:site-specific DNA-methyltransferase (adenine-specific)